MLEQIIRIIADELRDANPFVPLPEVTPDAHLRADLDLDQLAMHCIIAEIEGEFLIELTDAETERWETVGDIVASVEGVGA